MQDSGMELSAKRAAIRKEAPKEINSTSRIDHIFVLTSEMYASLATFADYSSDNASETCLKNATAWARVIPLTLSRWNTMSPIMTSKISWFTKKRIAFLFILYFSSRPKVAQKRHIALVTTLVPASRAVILKPNVSPFVSSNLVFSLQAASCTSETSKITYYREAITR